MSIQKLVACPQLTDFVEYYWVWEGTATPEAPQINAVLPSTIQSLIIVFGDPYQTITFDGQEVRSIQAGLVLGRVTTPRLYTRHTGRIGVFGVRFRPTGFYNLFGVPMAEITNETMALACAARSFSQELTQRVTEAETHVQRHQAAEELLLARLRQVQPAFNAVDFVASQIIDNHGQVSIDALATEANLSNRQLERQFLAKVGTSPKFYARLARFSHVFKILKEEPEANWVDVAYRCGYYDQAHFIREFHRFTGESPAAYFHHYDEYAQFFWAR
ncbi:helix-turn-helix domain-containing protein [Hymenobacter sp. BT635]|uniref:Helix-turn-helix domain-containing protein n=1 Tax=Hymenobacter nitidus TaxID=2880929 RepID=A0ABS8A881_9BACT|nr:helix-turn-helix domain-containing protein [Hymenobacter nitidus]MCB2376613.1 helix-turn-helix domain-containing protein [Hymenobacter nitidus]